LQPDHGAKADVVQAFGEQILAARSFPVQPATAPVVAKAITTNLLLMMCEGFFHFLPSHI
jgi:hypothetical protein